MEEMEPMEQMELMVLMVQMVLQEHILQVSLFLERMEEMERMGKAEKAVVAAEEVGDKMPYFPVQGLVAAAEVAVVREEKEGREELTVEVHLAFMYSIMDLMEISLILLFKQVPQE